MHMGGMIMMAYANLPGEKRNVSRKCLTRQIKQVANLMHETFGLRPRNSCAVLYLANPIFNPHIPSNRLRSVA